VSGNTQVIATAATNALTSLARIDLFIDGTPVDGVSSLSSPAVLTWDTNKVGDGQHFISVRAVDQQGGIGISPKVGVTVQNSGDCGCSAGGGGWEALGLLGILAALRRRRLA
jgi:uncharacterized protein (TIGR03382 family)